MYLIKTIKGTPRLMSDNEMDLTDLNLSMNEVYNCISKKQIVELFDGYKVKLTAKQLEKINNLVV